MTDTERNEALTVEETVALLRKHAFTVPEDSDTSDAGRTIVHSRLGGIGADWDLSDAIALAEQSTWRGWMDSLLGHNLGIVTTDADRTRCYAFDVPRPKVVVPTPDGDLAEAILCKMAEFADDWTIDADAKTACLERNHFDVTDEEMAYLLRLAPSYVDG